MKSAQPVRMATPPKADPKRAPKGCQVGDLFHLLGEPHVLDVLYVVLSGDKPRRFVEIQNELKMSPNTLSDRLRGLVSAGLLRRTAYNEIPPRVEYGPTQKALDFEPIFQGLIDWSKKHDLKPEPLPAPAP
jgi:DNA-binding HxlR family transcriptional regulator